MEKLFELVDRVDINDTVNFIRNVADTDIEIIKVVLYLAAATPRITDSTKKAILLIDEVIKEFPNVMTKDILINIRDHAEYKQNIEIMEYIDSVIAGIH